ncbi:MAG: hypothetical protein LBF22_10625 [Deltaproteobacteria bacterium]|nr:hypothetical protein [Deltaproteobacteria bacterium]
MGYEPVPLTGIGSFPSRITGYPKLFQEDHEVGLFVAFTVSRGDILRSYAAVPILCLNALDSPSQAIL